MKIWIDGLSFNNLNPLFFKQFINNLLKIDKENTYNIYVCKFLDINNNQNENFKIYKLNNYNNFIVKQTLFLNKLLQDKNDFLISFDEIKPIFYKKNTFQIISNMENILYPNIENTKFFKKYSSLYCIKSNLKSSKKIICYNQKTLREINEKLNIDEQKIIVLDSFFYSSPEIKSQIDIKLKHTISWDYLVYDAWIWNNKNIKRVIESLKEINLKNDLSIIFIWNELSRNLEIRQYIINLWLTSKIIFIWNSLENELWLYYKQSVWVIYPVLYDSFPVSLSNAINYSCNIIASDLDEIRDIFWDKITYFSNNSVSDITKKLLQFIKNTKAPNYWDILKKYNSDIYVEKIIKLYN